MALAPLAPMIREARSKGYAVGGFNFSDAETLLATLERAEKLRSPAMLITAPMETETVGMEFLVEMVRCAAARVTVPVCLHLDHATEVADVARAIEAGFSSVMIDASRHPFDENVRMTQAVVEMAHPRGISVEAELGAVGKADEATAEGGDHAGLTDPGEVVEFVRRTGIDALAVAIGNAHGIYAQLPSLDFGLLRNIAERTDIPLVLHGGSGTPSDQLQQAIGLGICKVNVASEIARAYMSTIHRFFEEEGKKCWYTIGLNRAKHAAGDVVERWMKELGSVGRV